LRRRAWSGQDEAAMKETPHFDAMDLVIIAQLQHDGRMPITELAERLGTSMATARRKLRRLLDEGIIQVGAIINPMYLGYRTVASIGLNVQPGTADAIAERLAALENVHFCSITIGRFDIVIWTLHREPDELNRFIKDELGKIPGVVRTETTMHMEIKKRTFKYMDPRIAITR
jgi:Lrp/AsnC family transcriptional regulator for asnA, asnC and gidA